MELINPKTKLETLAFYDRKTHITPQTELTKFSTDNQRGLWDPNGSTAASATAHPAIPTMAAIIRISYQRRWRNP